MIVSIYRRGSKSPMVKQIQAALHLIQDGYFGPLTEEAVRLFQMKNGLKPDGIVGPSTLAKLLPERLKKSKRIIREIIIHCSATPEYKHFTAANIRQWHKQQGWSDIGYHYVIQIDGTIEHGRDVDIIGAHCSGHNSHSIGICYIGGMDAEMTNAKDTRTELQKSALLSLLYDLRRIYPDAKIYGHRDFDKGKDCPSFDARYEYRMI